MMFVLFAYSSVVIQLKEYQRRKDLFQNLY